MMLWAAVGYTTRNEYSGKIKPGTWALMFGIGAGLAFATKETSALTFAATTATAILLLVGSRVLRDRGHSSSPNIDMGEMSSHMTLAAAGFALTSILFYSSFTSNWQGLYNAFIAAPLSYIHRAAGDAVSEGAAYHVHPWWQYLKWLFGGNTAFAIYSVSGMLTGICAFRKDHTGNRIPVPLKAGFIAITGFALSLTAIYSGIPYKTPWCALQMHTPVMAAGFLGFLLWALLHGRTGRFMMFGFSAMVLFWNASLVEKMWHDPDSKDIVYNYASASPQVKDMAKQIEEAVSSKNGGAQGFVAVAVPSEDTWPLPFYLRRINANVGYWTQFEELEMLAALNRRPDVVVVPAEQGHLVQPLFPHLKNTKRFAMRHRVRIRVFW
jgi:predicted membrane-bound mannosyltransferase